MSSRLQGGHFPEDSNIYFFWYWGKSIDLDLRFAVLESAEIHPDQKGFKRVLHPHNHMKNAVLGWVCSYDGRKKRLGNIILK